MFLKLFFIFYKKLLLYICSMNLKEFLEKHTIINKADLAASMWPDVKNARIKLHNKINEVTAGTGKQRITEKDLDLAKKHLKVMAADIDKIKM